MKLIDKDALIAYIKSCISDIKISQKTGFIKKRDANNRIIFFKSILSFINTLEVKEVDLEKKIDIEWNKCNPVDEGMGCEFATIGIEQFYFITKYFFELGQKGE